MDRRLRDRLPALAPCGIPLRSEADAFRFVWLTIGYFALIVIGSAINSWVGLAVFLVVTGVALWAIFRRRDRTSWMPGRAAVLTIEQVDPLPLRAELREVHRAALGAGALSDDWAANRLPLHVQRDDFVFLVAREGDELAGFGYGYTGAYKQWWTEHVARALSAAQREQWLDPPHFEIVELHVRPVPAAARRRQRAARAAAQPAAARPGAALDPDRLEEGAQLLREERLDRARGRRLRPGLPALPGAREAAARLAQARGAVTCRRPS